MSATESRFSSAISNPDMVIFLGADQFTDLAGASTLGSSAAGVFTKNIAANGAANFFITPECLLLRTGIIAQAAYVQNQFGTAAGVPGPSAVAGTSGPLGLPASLPTPTGAQLATVAGPTSGLAKKGMQINSVDIIYSVAGLAAALAQMGLTVTKYANNIAPTVTNLVALGANGLPTAIQANPYVITVNVANAAMIIPTVDSQVLLNIKLTAGATGTIQFVGAVLKCSFNLN